MSEVFLRAIIYVSAVMYAIALVLYICKKSKIGRLFWGTAVAGSVSLVVYNFIANDYVPFVSMYQVLTFVVVIFGVIYLFTAYFRDGKWTAPYIIGCSAFFSLGLCFMDINAVWHFPPALRSVFFVPHILLYVIAYGMAAVAFAMTVTKLLLRGNSDLQNRLDGGIYDCVCVLYPCMTAGMLIGAIWANEVWGAFWSFDIKECWSLVTWLLFTSWLHVRKSAGLAKYRDIILILGMAAVIVTFFFVNGMTGAGSSMHTYS